MKREFLYRDLTRDILNSAFTVHNTLGCGLLEKVYENALAWDLELKGRKVERQKKFKVSYKEREVGRYIADVVIDEKVIVEVKSADSLSLIHI